jgi:hypothetical protein
MNIGDWTSAVQNTVQVAAILIGGAWAYYKFIRGRTFHRRAELAITASLVPTGAAPAIRAQASMTNTGGADIPLRVKIIRVAAFDRKDLDDAEPPNWVEVATAAVFEAHDWIESHETIGDEVLVTLPAASASALAYMVTCVVYERRKQSRFRRNEGGGVAWTARSIVAA